MGGCGEGGVATIPLLVGEKCSAAEMNSKVGGKRERETERDAWVPRLSGSLAGLWVWLGCRLMAGKEGRVYR